MLIDLGSCSGCRACSVACKAEHRAPLMQFRTRVQTLETGQFPNVRQQFVPTLCQHCVDAPCLAACPTSAIVRADSGVIQIDEMRCVGSGDCVPACPYGAIFVDHDDGIAHKCDFCEDRVSTGEEPACVATCPTDALHFGRAEDPEIADLINSGAYVAQWDLAQTHPRVWYRGLDMTLASQLGTISPKAPVDEPHAANTHPSPRPDGSERRAAK